MAENTRDYFQREYNFFLKTYEIQFTHFMGVFYFWIAIVSFPATAGLIAKGSVISTPNFALLLHMLAALGFFLSAKMYDIRCSQLRYIGHMNQARKRLWNLIPENERPGDYSPAWEKFNPIKTALTDFGLIMAFVMSAINATYTGYALYVETLDKANAIRYGLTCWVFGVVVYVLFVVIKLRRRSAKQKKTSGAQQDECTVISEGMPSETP